MTLTDRIDARRVYLCGVALTVLGHLGFAFLAEGFWSAAACRAVTGIGWAGTYMTGLKLLADRVSPEMMSRAVTVHAASVGVAGALSFLFADMIAGALGWQGAFAVAAAMAAGGWLLVAAFAPTQHGGAMAGQGALFDFRPVLANRSAMAYALAYGVHTWELSALRGWAVAFLAFVALHTQTPAGVLAPAAVVTAMSLIGTGMSVVGNELTIRWGRQRLVAVAFFSAMVLAGGIGFLGPLSYALAVALMLFYGAVIWLDSAALTAGTAASAEPARRGATLAVHSMLGYAGGFFGPLVFGLSLDLAGGLGAYAWGVAFLHISLLLVLGRICFAWLRPRDLPGDRRSEP